MSKEVKRYELRIVDRYAGDGTGDIETDARMKQEAKGRYVAFDDYDALLAERDRLREERDSFQRVGIRTMAELAALKAVPDGVRRDAERYRFLMRELGGSVSQVVMGSPVFSNEDVNAAIDAALQGEQP